MRGLRRILFWLHLATGIAGGAVVFIMAATGAMLALKPEIVAFVERDARRVPASSMAQPRVPLHAILESVTAAAPGTQPTSVTMDAAPESAVSVAIGRDRVVYADPHTARVLGEGSARAQAFFRAIEDWHRWLGAPASQRSSARAVTGACNLAFLALAISGLYLWWPHKWTPQHTKAVMFFRRSKTGRARDFNWHNVAGFWCAPVLIVLTTSGAVMSYPWANALLYRLTGSAVPAAPRAGGPTGAEGAHQAAPPAAIFDADRLWATAERQLPEWRTITMRWPARDGAAVSFAISDARSWNPFARSQLDLDAPTGAVSRWSPYEASSAGQKARGWVRFGHTGELAGVPGQLVAGVACAGGLLLVWTGWSLAVRRLAAAVRPGRRADARSAA